MLTDVAQGLGEQRRRPARAARGRRPVEQRQDAPVGALIIGLGLARARRVGEPCQPVPGEPHPPFADHTTRTPDLPGDCPTAPAVGGKEHDPCALPQSTLRLTRARPALQRAPLCRRQRDRRRLLYRHANPVAWHFNLCKRALAAGRRLQLDRVPTRSRDARYGLFASMHFLVMGCRARLAHAAHRSEYLGPPPRGRRRAA
jgi:hypothetical protein